MTVEGLTRFGCRASWGRVAVIVWAVLLGIVGVRAVMQPDSHDCYKPFYEPAGRNWLRGEDLYQAKSATCRYSPLVNALFAPLALTPTPVGGLIWRAVNAFAFLGGLFWWLRAVAPPAWTRAHWAWMFLLVAPLSIPTINCAQANPLLTGLVLAGTAAAMRDRWNWAAVFVGGACLLKIYPIALALLFIVVAPRRFTPRFLIALAAGLALPFLLQDPLWVARQYTNWFTSLCIDDRTQWPFETCYRDLWLLLRFYHWPVSYRGYVVIQLLIAAGAAAVCWASRWWAPRPRVEVLNTAFGLAACWMTVCGPSTEGGGYILVAPTLAWAFLESWRQRRPQWVRGLLLASTVAFTVGVLACLSPGSSKWMAYGPHPLGGLFLLLAIGGESIQRIVEPAAKSATPARTAGYAVGGMHGPPRPVGEKRQASRRARRAAGLIPAGGPNGGDKPRRSPGRSSCGAR
jgi:Glycosyltransferase family 87